MSEAVLSDVRSALERVYDPCSIGVGAPMNIIDLGLLRSFTVDDAGTVHVVVATTTPVCMMVGSIVSGIEREVSAIPDVTGVEIVVDSSGYWTPELMTGPARTALDERRRHLVSTRNLVPRQWEQAPG